jgi:hypothetical protein
MPRERSLLERLDALAAFAPVLESTDFTFGAWAGGERSAEGVVTMPWYDLSDAAADFIGRGAAGWVTPDFDWPEWARSEEFERLWADPARIATAPPEHLGRLLTVFVRSERFGDGNLVAAFERGVLTAIARRAAALAAEMRGGPPGGSTDHPYHGGRDAGR